ncbi:hypothetical protein VIGAN_03205400, partial [Vigna angularis var. angularis]
ITYNKLLKLWSNISKINMKNFRCSLRLLLYVPRHFSSSILSLLDCIFRNTINSIGNFFPESSHPLLLRNFYFGSFLWGGGRNLIVSVYFNLFLIFLTAPLQVLIK